MSTRFDASFVIERLAVGSDPSRDADLRREGWDVLVLCAEERQRPALVPHLVRCPLVDRAYELEDPDKVRLLARAVREVVDIHRRGARVLVTCKAGQNRSALVASLVVKDILGVSGEEAVQIVRAGRNPDLWRRGHREGGNHVLVNSAFERYVTGKTREDPDAPFAFLRSLR